MITKLRIITYLIITLGLSIWGGFFVCWLLFFLWGMLMAVWEQPTHHWKTSIFKKWGWKQLDWDATISWKKVTKIGKYILPWDDSFHISKSLSILAVCFVPLATKGHEFTVWACLGLGWLTTESFNLFYNYVLVTTKATTDDTSRS